MLGKQAEVQERRLLESVRIDGRAVEKWHIQVEGRRLRVTDPKGIYVFCTPVAEYTNLEKELDALDGQLVSMGDFPHLVVQEQQEVDLELKDGCYYYDVLVFGPTEEHGIRLLDGGRLATSPGEVPSELTLEETKLVALKNIEVDIERAKRVKAKIVPMTAWGSCGRFIIAGFQLDKPENEAFFIKKLRKVRELLPQAQEGYFHIVMVDHLGGVDYSHGYDRREFRRFFG